MGADVLDLDVSPGTHVRDAIAQAVAAAIRTSRPAHFVFNGVDFTAFPTDTYDAAKQRWKDQTGHEVLSAEEESAAAGKWLDDTRAAQEKAISEAQVPTEAEMRAADVPWPKSMLELRDYIDSLVNRPHDYGTCVYAMSMAAVAAFQYVGGQLGVTGFQASCADLEIIRRTRHLEMFTIRNYEDLLYPQYAEKFDKTITSETWEALRKKATSLIENGGRVHPDVAAHWQSIADGQLPFGFIVKEKA